MIVIHDTLNVVGGTTTLMLRICEWCKKKEKDICIICSYRGNPEIEKRIEKLGVEIYETGGFCTDKLYEIMYDICKKNDFVTVINFNWNHYLDTELIKRRLSFSNIMYVVHPDCMKKGVNIKNHTLRELYKYPHKRIIEKMNADRAIVFMDEENLKVTEQFYGFSIIPNIENIRLPIDVPEIYNKNVLIKDGFSSKVILTASRAEFPFKLYLLGLIRVFAKIKEEYSEVKLEIISDGPDINNIKAEIDVLPDSIKKDITLLGWLSYEELLQKMEKCMIYVGMGTTVMEASKKYKLTIAAQHDSSELNAEGYFYENPNILLASEGCKEKGESLIKRVLGMDYDQYYKLCVASYQAVKEMYSIDYVMPQYFELDGGKRVVLSPLQRAIYRLYRNRRNREK